MKQFSTRGLNRKRHQLRHSLRFYWLDAVMIVGGHGVIQYVPADPVRQLPDDAAALKRIIAAMAQDAVKLRPRSPSCASSWPLRRAELGRSSEKLEREADQLELAIETALPDHLLREETTRRAPCTCPSCGGALRRIGEDITELLVLDEKDGAIPFGPDL